LNEKERVKENKRRCEKEGDSGGRVKRRGERKRECAIT